MIETPVVLTIAGSDSGGGAGIQADIKTMQAFGCFATSVITAVTAQNTREVMAIEEISLNMIEKQLKAVFEDIHVRAVKIGMLSSVEVIEKVANALLYYKPTFVVLDPVMVAKSGDSLLQTQAVDALKEKLFPLADVLTPNIPEAEKILGNKIRNYQDMQNAALEISKMAKPLVNAVIIKGGHLQQIKTSDDLLYWEKEKQFFKLTTPRIESLDTHGTGCTFSSAIASSLAHGLSIEKAVKEAKDYIHSAIYATKANHFSIIRQKFEKTEKEKISHGPVYHLTETQITWPKQLNKE